MSWKPNPLTKFKITDLGALKSGFNWICSSPGPDWIKHFHDLFQPQGIFGDRTGVDFIQWIISFPVTWTGTLKPHFGYTWPSSWKVMCRILGRQALRWKGGAAAAAVDIYLKIIKCTYNSFNIKYYLCVCALQNIYYKAFGCFDVIDNIWFKY